MDSARRVVDGQASELTCSEHLHVAHRRAQQLLVVVYCSIHDRSEFFFRTTNAKLSLKVRMLKAEVVEALLYGCATWTLRPEDYESLRTVQHKLLLCVVGFRRKDRVGYKTLYREVLGKTKCKRIETTIRKRQLWFAGAVARQDDGRLPKRVMFGRLAARGPKGTGRPSKHWGDRLKENLQLLGAVPRKGKERKWFVYGVETKDSEDWVSAAKVLRKWFRGVEEGAKVLEEAWRRTDLYQSRRRHEREAAELRAAKRSGSSDGNGRPGCPLCAGLE